jgi:dTDP-4-amino-4,6-dideoxygalactose transaminase
VLDAVLLAEANPVFADVDESLNVNAVTVAAALTPATKAVIVAHLFGNAAPIDEIEALLAGRGIAVIDDAAQALGARRGGRLVGTFGTFGIVSCGPGKPLAGAAGGLLVTNDASLAAGAAQVSLTHEASSVVASRALEFWVWRRFRRLTLPVRAILDRLVGEQAEPPHLRSPLSNLDAGIAFAQLRALERHAGERRANARLMLARLTGLPGRTITDLSADGAAVKLIWLLPPTGPPVRDVVAALARNGIEAQGGYVPAHLGVSNDAAVPTTMELWRRVLCIPLETRTPSPTPIGFGETPAPRPADETASALSRG